MNMAIIGCGAIGKRHAKWSSTYGNLIAVCDIVKERAINLAEKYNCRSYKSILQMLCDNKIDIDLVAICTPNGLHSLHTIQALKHGYHVLCEKPMALTLADCEEMIHIAEKTNKRLFVVKQNRFNPPVKEVKKAIDEGKLGDILSIHLSCIWNRNKEYYTKSDWKGSMNMDGGILYTQFSHFIDLLYYLIGDIDKTYSFSDNFMHTNVTKYADTVVTILKFANGSLGTAHFTINSNRKNMEGSLTIIGEKGTVKIGGQYLNTIEYQNIDNYKIPLIKSEGNCNEYGTYKGSMSNHDKVYKNVINVLAGKESIISNMLDGMKTIQIIKKICG